MKEGPATYTDHNDTTDVEVGVWWYPSVPGKVPEGPKKLGEWMKEICLPETYANIGPKSAAGPADVGMVHYPSDGSWYMVPNRRLANHIRTKYGMVLEELMNTPDGFEDTIKIDDFPTVRSECPYRLVITKPPVLSDILATQCRSAVVCGISSNVDNVACPMHQNKIACGHDLKVNDVVFVNGRDCHFMRGTTWYIGVYRVIEGKRTSCRVGVVKAFFDQARYFCNRPAQVTRVCPSTMNLKKRKKRSAEDKESAEDERMMDVAKETKGAALIRFLDVIDCLETTPVPRRH